MQEEIRVTQEEWEDCVLKAKTAAKGICQKSPYLRPYTQDAQSEAVMALLLYARTFDQSKAPTLWAYASKRVRGSVTDYLRKMQLVSKPSRKTQHLKQVNVPLERVQVRDPRLDSVVMARTSKALDSLLPRHRRVLVDHVSSGLLLKEIAKDLGVHETRVHQIYYQALEQVRGSIGVTVL